MKLMADLEKSKARGYAAIWGSGWLTDDAYVNARIWRAVTVALDTALGSPVQDQEQVDMNLAHDRARFSAEHEVGWPLAGGEVAAMGSAAYERGWDDAAAVIALLKK